VGRVNVAEAFKKFSCISASDARYWSPVSDANFT
jgi:hypothetical protein